jgi:hypothetical protein
MLTYLDSSITGRMKRTNATVSVENNAYSVLKLSVTRLMHVREVQATGGGHFAQVARELGYTRQAEAVDEASLKLAEQEKAQADQSRRKRSDALVERLKRARERLCLSSAPPDDGNQAGSSK